MKKVQILALHLNYGGIEKAITDLANNISDSYDVEVISTYKLSEKPAYELNKNISVRYLMTDLKPNKESLFKAVKSFRFFRATKELFIAVKVLKLRKKLMINAVKNSDADVLVSTRYFHNNLLSKYSKGDAIKIGWEHNYHENNKKYIDKVVKSCKYLDYLVLVSKELSTDYSKFMKGNCKCVYIPNMVDVKNPLKSTYERGSLVNVSRFSKEKGIIDLLDVVELVKKSISSIKLDLVGDGVMNDDVKKYILDHNLSNNVILHGFRDSDYVHKLLSKSSLYVMTSFSESFGISLLEAFSHGVPAIAFNSAKGACELINNGENGYLIDNRDKNIMAEEIVKLIKNEENITKLGSKALKTYSDYKPENVVIFWKNILH